VALSLFLVLAGVLYNPGVILAMTMPIVLIGLLLGRRALLSIALISTVIITLVAYLETVPGTPVVRSINQPSSPLIIGIAFFICIGVIALAIDRFNSSMRQMLCESANRQHELELLQASLEHTIAERTASLAMALHDVQQRETFLAQTLTDLQASQTLVRELSAPVIPVLAGVLVVPLVGSIDETRATGLAQHVLAQVEQQHAHTAIIDVTGVPLIDTHVAQTLLRTAAAIRLLGAKTFLVGVRPEVAQTIVSLGANLSAIPTFASLQEAVAELMRSTKTSLKPPMKL
jgi:anti-anti-sigma factor